MVAFTACGAATRRRPEDGAGRAAHTATAVLSAIAGAVLATLAVSPVPEVGFVIQAGGVGALIGTTVAVYRHHHGIHEPELRWLVARWSLAAAAAGLVYTLLTGLL